MFNPEIIFITISLLLLAGVAYWMRVPQVIIPLSIVYLLFVLLSDPSPKSLPNLKPIKNSTLGTEQKTATKLETNFEPLETTIQPTPLTFDSGRTKKTLLKKKIKNQPPKTLKKSKVKKINNQDTEVHTLRLRDIQICKNVEKRNPEGTDVFFNNDVDSLFCYTRIQNQGKKQEVKHVWYYEDQLMTQIRYNIKKSNIYRSWTRKTILPHQIGQWRVDIQDSAGKIIGSKEFQITS
jgi:hypothetical protein